MPAKLRCLISPRAESDLEDIWRFTAENWSPEQADRYHAGLLEAFDLLALGARMGLVVEVSAGYFKYVVGSHVLYYRQIEQGIEIVRILHQSMDVNRHL